MIEANNLVKIHFPVEKSTWHEMDGERLWASPNGSDTYKIKSIPMYVYGLSFSDVVRAIYSDDGLLHFVEVVERSGHSTYRIILHNGIIKKNFLALWEPLEKLGCSYESSMNPESIFAVDVPKNVNVYKAYYLLEVGVTEGIWDFEEGHCGHILDAEKTRIT